MEVVLPMLFRIADFFRYMSDNKEMRLYYVDPPDQRHPYAYQHSSIRDVGTICDILELVQFFRNRKISFDSTLFEKVVQKTLKAYHALYQKGEFRSLNIGDIGLFLLALKRCESVFPALLPDHWDLPLAERILERQRADGSFSLFFDDSESDLGGEAFYLPEALIGLIAAGRGKEAVKRSIDYQFSTRQRHIASDYATFYFNWQFQLLYHWIDRQGDQLQELFSALRHARIAHTPFGNHVATVEVACYMEGLAHGRSALKMLNLKSDPWVESEIERCLAFLEPLQTETLKDFHGGFIHSRFSDEARIDVAGHVMCGLCLLE